MEDDFLLMNPGPVPLEDRIREAMSAPMVSHRSPDFERVYRECRDGLQQVFQTQNDIAIINGTGTAALETAVSNCVDRGDRVVSLVNGKFGRRLRRISERYSDDVRSVDVEWGEPLNIEDVENHLEQGVDVVTMVHNETSTGILNPAPEVGRLAQEHDTMFIMDGVTSIGGDDGPVDKWGVDLAIVGSQKCLGAPPGLSALSVSENAKEWIESEKAPFYLDLKRHLSKAEDNQTPYTSSVSLFRGLREAIRIIQEEGLKSRVKRHRKLSRTVREAATEMGLELFPRLNDVSDYSNTVTAIEIPDETSDEEIRGGLGERNISISGGQAHLGGDIVRIATMGNVHESDV
ncbi:MAG: alanine--glyoxylate aminotransferase family protein, partial [Halobacteria archaeon]|nr:alanine--glyoxylate aminotransferase family protein [Halobacteria archaeon]